MPHWFRDVRPFRADPLGFLLRRGSASSTPLARLYLGPTPAWLVADPELVKPILKAPATEVDKGVHVDRMKPVFGESSLTMKSGPDHTARRDALLSILAKGQVERLVPELAAEVRMAAARVAAQRSFDARELGAALALRLVCVAVFGRNVLSPADEQVLIEVVNTLEADVADEMFRMLPVWPWQARRRARERAAGRRTLLMIVAKVRERAAQTSALHALSRLGLSDEDLANEVLTLLLAGHHTTGSNLAWIIHRLAREPELVEAIRAEATEASRGTGEVTAATLKEAPLSLAFVKEILRLYPSSWWYAREAQTDLELGGMPVKKGSWLIISPWQLHRDPRLWVEPDILRLDRAYTSKAWVPFGLGGRACTGIGLAMLEVQIVAMEFAAAFDMATRVPADVAPIPGVTLLPPSLPVEIAPAGLLRRTQEAA